ncbi:hypothetical protein BZG36_03326 [Bifiguratus adelaidae]|uniref:UDP-N-acetylglucosamine transferase subunit ALG14 n=1 Tax=Bifiguratus adelaidae TaxID=1938954 RepID=A0A261XXT6_9FUNG|nr:hypothetical protein BZG36_03326 [Bifiguratus adelaidae]
MSLLSIVSVCALLILGLSLRIAWVLLMRSRRKVHRKADAMVETLIVLGSGGHTAEMLQLLQSLDLQRYHRRHYIVGDDDPLSGKKARAMESQRGGIEGQDVASPLTLAETYPYFHTKAPSPHDMDSVTKWDVSRVSAWLAHLGFSAYDKHFREQGITGDVLIHLDHETLRDLSVHSLGKRIAILRAIYHLKVGQNIPIQEGDYVPPSTELENVVDVHTGLANSELRRFETMIQERDNIINGLRQDVNRLNNELVKVREEMTAIWRMAKEHQPLPIPEPAHSNSPYSAPMNATSPLNSRRPRLPNGSTVSLNRLPNSHLSPSTARSPGPTIMNSSESHLNNVPPSPHSPHDPYGSHRSGRLFQDPPVWEDASSTTPSVNIHDGGAIKVYGDEKINSCKELGDPSSKNVRASLDDPCTKVLIHALRKYKINDDWRQYALWIRYVGDDGTTGNDPFNLELAKKDAIITHGILVERSLNHDEKPLRLLQKLNQSKRNPSFQLKHIKDARPILLNSPANTAATAVRNQSLREPSKSTPTSNSSYSQKYNASTTSLHTLRDREGTITPSQATSHPSAASGGESPGHPPERAKTGQPLTPPITVRVTEPAAPSTPSKPPNNPDHYDLGLENGMAEAIASFMDSSNGSPKDASSNDSSKK